MKRIFALAAALALSGSMAFAAITADDVVKTYKDAGYTRIEVKTGPTQIKVEAIKQGAKIEVVYDKETGDVVKTESYTLDPSVVVDPGVQIRTTTKDFEDGDDSDDDGEDDDKDDDGEDDSDDDRDDDGSDDDGSDDDSSDDDSDDSDDDHGGDDSDDSDDDSDSDDDHGGSDDDGDDD